MHVTVTKFIAISMYIYMCIIPHQKFFFVGDNDLGSVRLCVRTSLCVFVRASVQDLSVRMNVSNTNAYFFPILYTCIYYNPSLNPVKFHLDHISNGRLIATLVCLIDKIFEKFVRSDEYLQHQ